MWHNGWGAGNWMVMTSMILLALCMAIATIVSHVHARSHAPSRHRSPRQSEDPRRTATGPGH
jgi:hypothetical protein